MMKGNTFASSAIETSYLFGTLASHLIKGCSLWAQSNHGQKQLGWGE